MRTAPFGAQLIERYLRSRGRRYFRGQHDGEYFFILTIGHERLHVHLELSPAEQDLCTIRVTPSYYLAATDRARMRAFVDRWNRTPHWVNAVVHESSDPTRIGVSAENSYPVADEVTYGDFANFLDQTIGSSIRFFAELPAAVQTPPRWVRDAG